MTKIPLILLMASLMLALTFTVSCTDDGGDENQSSSSINDELSSSSQIAEAGGGNRQSSSSIGGSSSSSATVDADNNSSSSLVNIGSSSSIIANGGGNNSSSNSAGSIRFTGTYALKDVTEDSFTYVEEYEDYVCKEGGNLVKEKQKDSEIVNYSISNNVLVWEYKWEDDSLHFAGVSNNLIGTWTRTKDKSTSCKFKTTFYETYWNCKYGWEIVEAEFSTSTLKITSDICLTDKLGDVDEGGWNYRVIDCNTFEASRGTEKIIEEVAFLGDKISSFSVTYNGKTCNLDFISPQENACTDAWNKVQTEGTGGSPYALEDYYMAFHRAGFYECMKENGFPEDIPH